jgi:D-arabinitol dehydrogenase (NADP+)
VKAAVFTAPGHSELRELPLPEAGRGEVRLRVLACGVCGTDAHIYAGHIRNARPPAVLGHEIYGEVDRVGPGVAAFQEGERVVVDPFVFCGSCSFCKRGEYRFCSNESFVGYDRPGGFAQYTVVPAANLYRIDPAVEVREAVLAETLSTVLAGLSRLGAEAGRSYLLLGAGTVGLLWCQLLLRSLPAALIQTELVAMRRGVARELGAPRVLSPQEEDLEEAVRQLCPHGVDYLVDATGSTEAVAQALPLLARGGTFLSFGICPEQERLPLSLNWFYQRQLRFLTSRRPPREMQRALTLLERGLVSAGRLVTGSRPLEEIEEAFRCFHEAKDREIKMMIDPWL